MAFLFLSSWQGLSSLPGLLEQRHCIFDTICSYQREQNQQSLSYTSCDLKTFPETLKDLP